MKKCLEILYVFCIVFFIYCVIKAIIGEFSDMKYPILMTALTVIMGILTTLINKYEKLNHDIKTNYEEFNKHN